MREVIFRNLTSINARKKDIFLKEIFERNGIVAKTEKRSLYMIKDITHMNSQEDLKIWISEHGDIGVVNKRHFHIYKVYNEKLGHDKIICRIVGIFYVVVDSSVYTIAFLNSFKLCLSKETLK